MSSKVSICNSALSKLGADRITALTDNTKSAKEVSAIYDDVADNIMALGWSSTKRRTTLAQSSVAPTWGYTYRYALPTDPKCMKMVWDLWTIK